MNLPPLALALLGLLIFFPSSTFLKCTIPGCWFKRDDGVVTEDHLQCKDPKVQLAVELRATSNNKVHLCEVCNKKTAAKVRGRERSSLPCARFGNGGWLSFHGCTTAVAAARVKREPA